MTQLTTDDLNLLALDRAIAQELDLPAGENIPRYTTDSNEAIELMKDSWKLHKVNETARQYGRQRWEIIYGGYGITRDGEDTPALAICKARFPHLFKDKFQSS